MEQNGCRRAHPSEAGVHSAPLTLSTDGQVGGRVKHDEKPWIFGKYRAVIGEIAPAGGGQMGS